MSSLGPLLNGMSTLFIEIEMEQKHCRSRGKVSTTGDVQVMGDEPLRCSLFTLNVWCGALMADGFEFFVYLFVASSGPLI
jgi:hypothetical protein